MGKWIAITPIEECCQKWLWPYCRRTYTTCSRCGCRGHWDKFEPLDMRQKDAGAKNPTPAEVVAVPAMCMSQVEEVINSIQMSLACNVKKHGKQIFVCGALAITFGKWPNETGSFALFTSFYCVSVCFCIPVWSKCHPPIHLFFQGMLRNARQVCWSFVFENPHSKVANLIRWYLYQSVSAV